MINIPLNDIFYGATDEIFKLTRFSGASKIIRFYLIRGYSVSHGLQYGGKVFIYIEKTKDELMTFLLILQ
jgi:hypothetical protein